MKATDLLKRQHREVKALFKKLEGTDNPRMRRQLMNEVARNLEGHTLIEEEMFYPAVRGLETQKAEEMVCEAYEEHHVVKLVLAELPRVNPEDERFEAKMTVLSELVEHHVQEEEKEMFKLAQKLGRNELTELGAQMEERFETLRAKAAEAA
jgi:Hemerythrin HHE cation binding domain